ncbi:MAG TPA: amidase family protein [Polyangia bacterium]|nr:amidase family protein [Polyangia bacterium]
MAIAEYDHLDGLGLAALVRARQITPAELLDEAIARLERVNPRINAVVTPLYDEARQTVAGTLPDGPFRGVPFLLKDLVAALGGAPLSFGSRFVSGYKPEADSNLVERYRKAGVVFFGKTNTPEFGIMPCTEPALFGPTLNPWGREFTPGGSSGGAAAAVAAGVIPVAHGSDGGGSIRIPASCCGLFGLKPTRGRTPVGPEYSELWGGLAVDHVVSRSVRDSAAMLDATTGPETTSRFHVSPSSRPFADEVGAPPGRLRIALTTRPHLALSDTKVHPDCLAANQDAGKLLASLGHDVEEVDLDVDALALARDFLLLVSVQIAAAIAEVSRIRQRGPRRGEIEVDTALMAMYGRQQSAVRFAQAQEHFNAVARKVTHFFESYDVLVSPVLGQPPIAIGALQPRGPEALARRVVAATGLSGVLRIPGLMTASVRPIFRFVPFTPLANVTGQPSMSVPLYWSKGGLPIGTLFTARYGDEATLFRLAAQLEEARPWWHRRPAVYATEAAARPELSFS